MHFGLMSIYFKKDHEPSLRVDFLFLCHSDRDLLPRSVYVFNTPVSKCPLYADTHNLTILNQRLMSRIRWLIYQMSLGI